MSATVSSVDAREVIVDIHAAPGMRVGFGTTLKKDEGTPTDAAGNARVILPRSAWQSNGGHAFEIVGTGKSLLKERYGFAKAPLEMPIRALTRIPERPLWFALLDAGREPEGAAGGKPGASTAGDARERAVHLHLREAGAAADPAAPPRFDAAPPIAPRWLPDAAGMPIRIAATPGARVELGSASLDADPSGLTRAELPSRDLAASTTMETLALRARTLVVPVRVTKDGATETSSLTFDVTRADAPFWVASLVDGVAAGTRLPDAQQLVDAVVLRKRSGRLLHVGAPGRVAQARWVAREEVTERKGASCVYTSFSRSIVYEDATIRVYDAHGGGEVAKASFRAPTARCAVVATSADSFVYGTPDDTLTGWLEKSMARGWK